MITRFLKYCAAFFTLCANILVAQSIIESHTELLIQPYPKEVVPLHKAFVIDEGEKISIAPVINREEQKALSYLNHLLENKLGEKIIDEQKSTARFNITFSKIIDKTNELNNQFYSIQCNDHKINLEYKNQLGLLFGVVTLSGYFENVEDQIRINLFNVVDFPDFSIRIISSNPRPNDVFELLDFALKNKIETIAIASRQYPWYKITEDYKNLFTEIKKWRDEFGGPNIMQMHNIYEEKDIVISDEADISALKKVIKYGIDNGADKLMILADDTPPFVYGAGYILTDDKDKKSFKHMAEAHCYLMGNLKKWIKKKSLEVELFYVPPFYTYEDMHYGEMNLYKNTPWEKDAYEPFYRDLNYLGLNMPEDVFIIWTGPYVRSRTITSEDINDWTYNLKGITPFLWDNTIYSHNPFISTPLFSFYDNKFPADFNNLTAGNGIFINGDANMEDSKVSVITANDYMWNSKLYSPYTSFEKAMTKLYGQNKKLLLDLKEIELKLRKVIGERELWFESDSLWKIIRKIRYIHSKNPFDYHFNYTRMKGLRMQLKNSVPVPGDKKPFLLRCETLLKRRNQILDDLNNKMPDIANDLEKVLLDLPNLDEIK